MDEALAIFTLFAAAIAAYGAFLKLRIRKLRAHLVDLEKAKSPPA